LEKSNKRTENTCNCSNS